MIRIKRGLDLPIAGAPLQKNGSSQAVRSVALLGRDYVGVKPAMAVKAGDRVKLGQVLFTDKKITSVKYTSPGAGIVTAIHRGLKRRLLSVVIELDAPDTGAGQAEEQVELRQHSDKQIAALTRTAVVQDLLESGLWTALRTRPFSKVPDPATTPHSLFINAMDSNPLAADPAVVIAAHLQDFVTGVNILARLPRYRLHLCMAPELVTVLKGAGCNTADSNDPGFQYTGSKDLGSKKIDSKKIDSKKIDSKKIDSKKTGTKETVFNGNVELHQFKGPHPAGLTGTHIHFLEPAGAQKVIWSINYQDVIAIAKLFRTGKLWVERSLALAGPQVLEPRLVRSRIGANLNELVETELLPYESRAISGSVLAGDKAAGVEAYLGRYHLQVSVLREGRERPLLGYLSPGVNRHSVMGIYISSFYRTDRKLAMSTSTQGSDRAMVPIGAYEKVMPLDILPTQLLRALIVGDIETAMNLGALELDEEDLALCSYVCPGKYAYGPILRTALQRIEKEVLS